MIALYLENIQWYTSGINLVYRIIVPLYRTTICIAYAVTAKRLDRHCMIFDMSETNRLMHECTWHGWVNHYHVETVTVPLYKSKLLNK
jgi:hypothetical protein